MFGLRVIGISLLQGLSVLLIILAVFYITLRYGQGEFDARALTFCTLIIANLGLILTNRSWTRTVLSTLKSPNKALWWVMTGALIFLAAVLYIPALRKLFRFSFLHPLDLLICLGAGVFSVMWFEVLKVLQKKKGLAIQYFHHRL